MLSMAAGTLLVFAPALAVLYPALHSLTAVWGAKALLNAWRLACAAVLVHVVYPREGAGDSHAV